MKRSLPVLNIYSLFIFYHVCEEKSITNAADKICLSQPAVTQHIKSLENHTQVKLVQIERKKLILTPAGEGLYQYAREIFQQAMATDRFIELVKESSLNIGASSLFVKVIARAINNMSAHFNPTIKLNVKFGESCSLFKEVIDSKIDLAVIPDLDYSSCNLSRARIADEVKLRFYASPSNPIFQKEVSGWFDLLDYPLVIGSEESSLKKLISDKLISEGLNRQPKYYLTADNIEFRKNIVQTGNSISVALKEDIEDELNKGVLKVLPSSTDIRLGIDVVSHKSHFPTSLVQNFITCAKWSFRFAL